MKLKLTNGQNIEVNFWSYLKFHVLGHLILNAIMMILGLILALLLSIQL